jgi:hypothetical protein
VGNTHFTALNLLTGGFPADSNECTSRRHEDSNLGDHTGPTVVVYGDIYVTWIIGAAV